MSAAAHSMTIPAAPAETLDPAWHDLYRIAGWAAVLSAIFFPIQIAVFIVAPPPGFDPSAANALSWLTYFHTSRFLALLDLDLLIIVDEVLAVPILLALYVALRKVNRSWATLGLVFGLLGVAAYFSSSPTIAMMALSDQYAAAAGEAARAASLAAAQVLLANYQGTAFHAFYVLGSLAPILLCAVMLRSHIFDRRIAILGIVANAVALGLYIPVIGVAVSVFSVVLLEVWNILLARRLLRPQLS